MDKGIVFSQTQVLDYPPPRNWPARSLSRRVCNDQPGLTALGVQKDDRRLRSLAVSEDNGKSKEDEGKKEGNRDLHNDVSLSAVGAWRNLTDGDTLETFVLELCFTGETTSL